MTAPDGRRPAAPEPTLRPTSPATLAVAAIAAAALAWLLVSEFYGRMPRLNLVPVLTLGALAVVEAVLAHSTRARIDRRPGHPPVNPLVVARFVVLAKASSLTGALVAGWYAGLVVWLLIERERGLAAAAEDLPAALAGVVACGGLVAAALWLERSCRVPPQPDERSEPPGPVEPA